LGTGLRNRGGEESPSCLWERNVVKVCSGLGGHTNNGGKRKRGGKPPHIQGKKRGKVFANTRRNGEKSVRKNP